MPPSSLGNDLHPLPHAQILEEILGVPLVPGIIQGVPLTSDTIRGFVYSSVLGQIRQHLPRQYKREGIELSAEQIAELRRLPAIQRAGAELSAANDTLLNWHQPPEMPKEADAADTPRGIKQARAVRRLVEHSQRAPFYSEDPDSPYRDGFLTVAPPGFGKTALIGLITNYSGIGLPVSSALPQTRKAVGILHSKALIEDYLDPDGTLQRFINVGGRDVKVGAFYSHRRDGHDENDLLLTTPDSYESAVKKKALDPHAAIRNLLDEAHRTALAPRMQRHISNFGAGLYLFTATPAIAGGRRDLRRKFPHSQIGTMREYVHDGILSPIQLFTYRAGPEPGSALNIAISEAANMLRKGLKTLVVCQPGNYIDQARQVAHRINDLYRDGVITPHPRFDKIDPQEIACAIGSDPALNTSESIRRVRRDERLLLTTVATGNEGLNIVDLDGLIIIGPQGAQWQVDQWVGRVDRPSGRPAVAVEIFPHKVAEGRSLASIFRSFDLQDELIISGRYIGPEAFEDEELEEAASHGPEVSRPSLLGNLAIGNAELTAETSDEGGESPQAVPGVTTPTAEEAETPDQPELYTPSTEFSDLLLDNIPLREATLAPADLAKLPPPDYKPFDLILPQGVPIEWLYNILAKQTNPDIRYVGIWEADEEGNMRYVRYYSPAAHRYMEEHPIPELVGQTEFFDYDIAVMLGVSRNRIRTIIAGLDIQPMRRSTKYKRNIKCYNTEAVARIAQELEKIPRAEETDVPVPELGEELHIETMTDFMARYNIIPVDKYRHPLWGVSGVVRHVTEAEATFLREVHYSIEPADLELHMPVREIADRTGFKHRYVLKRLDILPDDQKPFIEWRHSVRQLAMFVTREWGEAFTEYLKPEKILPWETTALMLAKYFGMPTPNMQKLCKGKETARISIYGIDDIFVYPLSLIPSLIRAGLKPIDGAPIVKPGLAALSQKDINNKKRLAYSQTVQHHFLPPEHLPLLSEIEYYQERRSSPPQLPDPKLSLPASKTPQSAQDAPRTSLRNANANKSHPLGAAIQDRVSLYEYLKRENALCAPPLLPRLARQNSINTTSWLTTNQGVFVPEADAGIIALAVKEHEIAPLTIGDPEADRVAVSRLAAEFSGRQTNVSEGDVHKVALRILQQRSMPLEQVVIPLRIREPDGTAGMLALHYTKRFADEIRTQLKALEAARQLAAIRRW